jgi:hypothetical protein
LPGGFEVENAESGIVFQEILFPFKNQNSTIISHGHPTGLSNTIDDFRSAAACRLWRDKLLIVECRNDINPSWLSFVPQTAPVIRDPLGMSFGAGR